MANLEKVLETRPAVLLLRVNSPGGTVGATQEIYYLLKRIKNNGTKIVALMEDMAASGGFYVCMAADKIIANPGTITGSIGVIIRGFEYSKIIEWLQIKVNTIKSGEHKDIMSPTRPMTEWEESLLKRTVLDAYEQFCQTIIEERKVSPEHLKSFADGRIFTGREAMDLGMVDGLGGFHEAVEMAQKVGGMGKKKKIEKLQSPTSLLREITSQMNQIVASTPSGIPLWLMSTNKF